MGEVDGSADGSARGWLRRGVTDVSGLGSDSAALVVRDGTLISVNSFSVAAVAARLEAQGIACEPLRVSHAFHSELMRPALATLGRALSDVAWRAPVFIDTTGDGDLGALAGCAWEIGEAKDCPCQPMSLNALLVCKDAEALAAFIHKSDPSAADGLAKDALGRAQAATAEAIKAGKLEQGIGDGRVLLVLEQRLAVLAHVRLEGHLERAGDADQRHR